MGKKITLSGKQVQETSQGYYVSTAGLNEATTAKYVREQEKHDQMMDRIMTKEAEDPFRGGQVIGASGLNKVKAA
ncbi:MAG: hypothetical protein JXA25_19660 [Anaerolineales bacterium]|nr:hypothetical protein [Anaerolineales bacterium]